MRELCEELPKAFGKRKKTQLFALPWYLQGLHSAGSQGILDISADVAQILALPLLLVTESQSSVRTGRHPYLYCPLG